jgi:hypothetical protein
MKTPTFVILYLIVMLFTYVWRMAVVGGAMDGGTTVEDVKNMASVVNWILFFNYVVLALIANSRGKKIEKKYLVAFPIIGGFFDVLLGFIPLVPTIMNILALVFGLSDGKQEVKVVYVEKPTSETKSESKS